MTKVVDVKLWGTIIGYLGYLENSNIAQFEYDEKFMRSGIYPSPLLMQYPPSIFSFENISFNTFGGIPGVFSDSLPDKFGNQLIDQFMAQKNIPQDKITTLDRLLYIGKRGMGALEYHPTEFKNDFKSSGALDIALLSELADMVINKKDVLNKEIENQNKKDAALNLIKIGSSAGGARSKALVAKKSDGKLYDGTELYDEDCSYWLLKFDSSANKDRDNTDPKGMTKVEYIYSLIARKCKIIIPNTDYIIDKDDFHFMIERFDRVVENNKTTKLHYISWAGMSHYDRDTTGAYSYEQLVLNAKQLKLGQNEITQIFRRAVFNVIGRNQDDHTKNFGFLMDKSGKWTLSPAFDMTYSYDPNGKWTRVHQIKLRNKQDNFTKEDIIEFGKYCNLSEKQSLEILAITMKEFLSFEAYADEFKVDTKLKNTVLSSIRKL
ncbi:MAG TPA: type II toxin-antitoxin system HipA family toxin [Sulfurospirillum arcachonense]|nr:type II toxin-antitoxin system HipA family toxin [Sulfurospirillum arcachonense]HIP44362.1 type II toxin-antitoxin system HipA family toxin [Sulfurospirillum arcachonense]